VKFRVIRILTIASFLLFLVASTLWVASYWRSDTLYRSVNWTEGLVGHESRYWLRIGRGKFAVGHGWQSAVQDSRQIKNWPTGPFNDWQTDVPPPASFGEPDDTWLNKRGYWFTLIPTPPSFRCGRRFW